ncbi:MAG: hypothetical protein M1838_005420 [Thelocarpon superellum]|nr:MAG: hypothetical protein M1838_005420 [Thelocarpon superellum]
MNPLTLSDARPADSIWTGVGGQATFRRNVDQLRKSTKDLPRLPQINHRDERSTGGKVDDAVYLLPFDVERQLASDIAFLAATEGSRDDVTAVAVEQQIHPPSLILKIAANQGVSAEVQSSIKEIFRLMDICARNGTSYNSEACVKGLLNHVMTMNHARIKARLKPSPAGCQTPYTERLLYMSRRYRSFGDPQQAQIQAKIQALHAQYLKLTQAEDQRTEKECTEEFLHGAYKLSSFGKKMDLLSILTRFDPALDEAELKAVRTVDKLGNYWRICSFLLFRPSRPRNKGVSMRRYS